MNSTRNLTILQDFIENLVLADLADDYHRLLNLQEYIDHRLIKGDDLITAFCRYFELGQGVIDIIELTNFPLEDWWNNWLEENQEV